MIFVAADERDLVERTEREADAAVQRFKSLIQNEARVGIAGA